MIGCSAQEEKSALKPLTRVNLYLQSLQVFCHNDTKVTNGRGEIDRVSLGGWKGKMEVNMIKIPCIVHL